MTDEIKNMGSLLSRMTADEKSSFKLNDNQIVAVVEVLIPQLVKGLPGMPADMRCEVTADETGWTIRVERPE